VASPEFTVVGRVRKAHGIRGELVVEAITDRPEALFASGRRLFAGSAAGGVAQGARELTITHATRFKGGWIVGFAGIADRNEAELWRDRYLLVPNDELEPPGENEVYLHDLIGMRVELQSGAALGEVGEVYELPQGLVLDVRTGEGSVVLPYRPEVVLEVDLAERRIRVDPPEGMLD